jgi:hypothetical protein
MAIGKVLVSGKSEQTTLKGERVRNRKPVSVASREGECKRTCSATAKPWRPHNKPNRECPLT